MKKIIGVCLILFKINVMFSQVIAQGSAGYYIKNLGWESLFIKPTYTTELVLNTDAEGLVCKDDRTVKKLFSEISSDGN